MRETGGCPSAHTVHHIVQQATEALDMRLRAYAKLFNKNRK